MTIDKETVVGGAGSERGGSERELGAPDAPADSESESGLLDASKYVALAEENPERKGKLNQWFEGVMLKLPSSLQSQLTVGSGGQQSGICAELSKRDTQTAELLRIQCSDSGATGSAWKARVFQPGNSSQLKPHHVALFLVCTARRKTHKFSKEDIARAQSFFVDPATNPLWARVEPELRAEPAEVLKAREPDRAPVPLAHPFGTFAHSPMLASLVDSLESARPPALWCEFIDALAKECGVHNFEPNEPLRLSVLGQIVRSAETKAGDHLAGNLCYLTIKAVRSLRDAQAVVPAAQTVRLLYLLIGLGQDQAFAAMASGFRSGQDQSMSISSVPGSPIPVVPRSDTRQQQTGSPEGERLTRQHLGAALVGKGLLLRQNPGSGGGLLPRSLVGDTEPLQFGWLNLTQAIENQIAAMASPGALFAEIASVVQDLAKDSFEPIAPELLKLWLADYERCHGTRPMLCLSGDSPGEAATRVSAFLKEKLEMPAFSLGETPADQPLAGLLNTMSNHLLIAMQEVQTLSRQAPATKGLM
jgi:hypothetical protein